MFLVALVSFEECSACREDRRKCQEQSANFGTEYFGDKPGQCRDNSAESETQCVLMPLCLLCCAEIDSDSHRTIDQMPNATPNHTKSEPSETAKVDSLAVIGGWFFLGFSHGNKFYVAAASFR